MTVDNLERSLLRWAAEGLITPEQAQRIRFSERAQLPENDDFGISIDPGPAAHPAAHAMLQLQAGPPVKPAEQSIERSLIALEALAYFGTTLVLVALAVVLGRNWQDLETWSRVSIFLSSAVVTYLAGLGLGKLSIAPYRRLGSAMWALSVGFITATAIYMTLDDGVRIADGWSLLIVSVIPLLYGGVLWLHRKSALLQLLTFGALTATACSILAIPSDQPATMWFGLAVTTVGVIWLLMNWAEAIVPARPGWILGASSTLIGLQLVSVTDHRLSAVSGLVAALLLAVAGVVMSKNSLLAIGSVGVLVFVYQCVYLWFKNSPVVNLVMLTVGIAVVAVVIMRMHASARTRQAQ